MMWRGTLFSWWLVCALGSSASASPTPVVSSKPGASKAALPDFVRDVQPLLSQYCYGCHGEKKKGDLDLRVYTDEKLAAANPQLFVKLATKLESHEMPPENKPQPSAEQRRTISAWINSVFSPCDPRHPDPGRVTLRRLNRVEYNNTICDLVAVHFQPADDFPADDSGYGFDNIGDVLSLSTVLVERYLAAAEKILDAAIPARSATNGVATRAPPVRSEAYRRILICQPTPTTQTQCARRIVSAFAGRAFRRPVGAEEVDRLMTLFQSAQARGDDFESSVKVALEAVLVAPDFLFRGQLRPEQRPAAGVHPVDEFALASRLSYFLWSSMPDDELFALADRKSLRRNLDHQVRRMLEDPRAHALAENFAGQWLQLRNLALVTPDAKAFPDFNEDMRADMRRESELFFEHILRENRSILEFLDADYTLLNGRLAQLYGLPGVEGDDFRQISLKGTARGGLLTQASILTLTSNPTRTSPVKRGKWVLENILGDPPPPPPPNVPELKEKGALTGTLRQRMEQHRSDPNCAACHARMDPIGFGFENFNAIGAWRDKDADLPIDPSGRLIGGEAFHGPAELKTILVSQKADRFARCLAEKLLTYALGRGLEYYDECAIDQITQRLAKGQYKFATLILEITRSVPFQMTRSEKPPSAVALGSASTAPR
jgi:hypothetical protein